MLSGEKHGPKGTFAQSMRERAEQAVPEGMDVDEATVAVGQRAKEIAGEAKDAVKEGIQKVRSFDQAVKEKAKVEKSAPGWESSAFDVSA